MIQIHKQAFARKLSAPIPWKLTSPLDKQQQLFYKKLSTNYAVDAFICSCGHTEFIIRDQEQTIAYQCAECKNKYFYDANQAWRNYHTFISNDNPNLSFEYHISKKEKSVSVGYAVLLPKSIDLIRNRVEFEYKDIYKISIDERGDIAKEYETKIDTLIFEKMEQKLVRYIAIFRCFGIEYDKNKKLTLAKILFFLRHKYLKSTEYYYWKEIDALLPDENRSYDIAQGIAKISNYRKERSVKRAVYAEYLRQMSGEHYFHPGCINIFSRTIEDPNILVRLLSLSFLKHIEQLWIELEGFIWFLKQFYSEKQIAKLFEIEAGDDESFLFRDTVVMLAYDHETIEENFRKVRCTVAALHDEFSRCQYQKQMSKTSEYLFVYTKTELEKCIYASGYRVQLPESNLELYSWGERLHNCLFTYVSSVKKRKSIIYGFFIGDEIDFAVEIKNGQIIQASCKYNAALDEEEKFILYEWFGRFFK